MVSRKLSKSTLLMSCPLIIIRPVVGSKKRYNKRTMVDLLKTEIMSNNSYHIISGKVVSVFLVC